MATQNNSTSTFMTPAPLSYYSGNVVKPTLLAFHGSGSNATVHTVQLARLMRVLKEHFEVESLQAPFPSPAGPGVLPFFDGCGPFVRWLPPGEKVSVEKMKSGDSTSAMAPEVECLVRDTVRQVVGRGGRVVGLVGFSQGTKIVAGLLRGAEIRRAVLGADKKRSDGERESDWLDFSFALSVCGSYPPPLIPPTATALLASSVSLSEDEKKEVLRRKISVPTLHVQGLQDEWLWAGRGLIEGHYEVGEGGGEVVEWEMGHHYPVRVEESERIGEWLVGQLGRVEGEKSRV